MKNRKKTRRGCPGYPQARNPSVCSDLWQLQDRDNKISLFSKIMSTHDLSDLSEVNQLHSAEPTLSIFFNRTIDWEDNTPNSTRVIVDFTILSIGLPLNFIILMTILTKTRLHNPIGCYIMSLTISNFVLLLNVLDDVLYHWFDIYFEPDLDFVGRVTLQSSSMTLVAFTLDRYMTICRRDTMWYKSATKLTTAVKGVLVIWCYASIATAMELNLYEHFRTRTIINIFCWSTGMYVALPTVIIVFLDSLMVMEIAENRDLEIVRWSCRDLAGLRLLGTFYSTLNLAFFNSFSYPYFCLLKFESIMCRKFWTFIWTKVKINLLLLERFCFSSSEKFNFEKENGIFLNTFLNFNLFYLMVVIFLWISFIWTFRTSGTLLAANCKFFQFVFRCWDQGCVY